MAKNIEKLLDEAISRMKKGERADAVLLDMPESTPELEPLLQTLQMGMQIPKKEVPSPDRRRKFLTVEVKTSLWAKYFSLTKFALMPLSLLLIFAAAFTAEATPGQPLLYSVRNAIQRAPLAFIQDPTQRAQKEVELSEQSLSEAENYLNSSNQNSNLAASVIAQATKQASQTVNSVKNVARDNAVAKNPELLNKLVSIAQKQEKLVSTIAPQADTPQDASTLAASKEESTLTVATVNKLVATVNEQVIANLGPGNSIDNQIQTPAPASASTDKPAGSKTETVAKTDAKPKTTLTKTAKDSGPDPAPEDATADAKKDTTLPNGSNPVSGNFIIEPSNQNLSK